jgi:hypothetical protein
LRIAAVADIYREDLAYVHDAGFGALAKAAAENLVLIHTRYVEFSISAAVRA